MLNEGRFEHWVLARTEASLSITSVEEGHRHKKHGTFIPSWMKKR